MSICLHILPVRLTQINTDIQPRMLPSFFIRLCACFSPIFSDPHSLRPVRGRKRADPCCHPSTVLYSSETSIFSPFIISFNFQRIFAHGAYLLFDSGYVPPAQAASESQVRQQVFPGRKQFYINVVFSSINFNTF